MRTLASLLTASALALLTPGCAEPHPDPSPGQLQLDSARTSFDAAPSGYSFERSQACECLDDFAALMRIEVVNDSIIGAIYIESEETVPANVIANLMTIDDVFDEIQDAINEDLPHEVTYDGELGYPMSVFIDRVPAAADDELSLTITNFQPLALALED